MLEVDSYHVPLLKIKMCKSMDDLALRKIKKLLASHLGNDLTNRVAKSFITSVIVQGAEVDMWVAGLQMAGNWKDSKIVLERMGHTSWAQVHARSRWWLCYQSP